MTYTGKCADGPGKGKEFEDSGPTVAVDIPYRGQVLKYHLVSVLDHECTYRFCGLSDERDPLSFFPFKESTA
jgi:hypothetical protein